MLSGRETVGDDGEHKKLKQWLSEMREETIKTNAEWAKKLGINPSTAITAVKPSGTVSQLVDSASGIHPRYSPYYIRRVRASAGDPLCSVLEASGVPVEDDLMSPNTKVFSFVKKAPEGAVVTKDMGAMEQLKLWEIYQDHWCEHKPSITVYYKDSEFLEVGQWLYNTFDKVSGVSFLPYSDHTYKQAPYEEITKKEYNELLKGLPVDISWDIQEESDMTEGAQTLACVGGACEI